MTMLRNILLSFPGYQKFEDKINEPEVLEIYTETVKSESQSENRKIMETLINKRDDYDVAPINTEESNNRIKAETEYEIIEIISDDETDIKILPEIKLLPEAVEIDSEDEADVIFIPAEKKSDYNDNVKIHTEDVKSDEETAVIIAQEPILNKSSVEDKDEVAGDREKILKLLRECYVNVHNSIDLTKISNCKQCLRLNLAADRKNFRTNCGNNVLCKRQRLQCNLCQKFYSSKLYLKYHACTGQKEDERKNISVEYKYEIKDQYKIPEAAYYEEIHYVCRKCSKCFDQKSTLMEHLRIHVQEEDFTCRECGKSYRKKFNLERHIMTHTRPYNCSECSKSFRRLLQLKSHKATEHGRKRGVKIIMCKYCKQEFTFVGVLKKHYLIVHPDEKPYQCKECKKDFKFEPNMTQHEKIHSTERPFECGECGKAFKFKTVLKQHQKSHTGEFSYFCNECGKGYKHKIGLKKHFLNHSDEFSFDCNFCKKSFKFEKCVMEHQKIHRKFPCKDCGKVFKFKSHLRRHILTHSTEKPYDCDDCGKFFKLKVYLRQHWKKVHGTKKILKPRIIPKGKASGSGEKVVKPKNRPVRNNEMSYDCKESGKGFKSNRNLRRHLGGKKSYNCDKCGKVFTGNTNLKLHRLSETACFKAQQNLSWKKERMKFGNFNASNQTGGNSGDCDYSCFECGKLFKLKIGLKQHCLRSHVKINICE